MLQCGDPTGTGSGGPGYTIPDENLSRQAAGATYPAGTVAMANTGQAHSGGSQFFLVYKDSQLPRTTRRSAPSAPPASRCSPRSPPRAWPAVPATALRTRPW